MTAFWSGKEKETGFSLQWHYTCTVDSCNPGHRLFGMPKAGKCIILSAMEVINVQHQKQHVVAFTFCTQHVYSYEKAGKHDFFLILSASWQYRWNAICFAFLCRLSLGFSNVILKFPSALQVSLSARCVIKELVTLEISSQSCLCYDRTFYYGLPQVT